MVNDCSLWINFYRNELKKNFEEKKFLKFFDFCLRKKKYKNISNSEEFYKFIDANKYFEIFRKAKFLLKKKNYCFYAKVKKDFKILFKCIDKIYSLNEPNYVISQKKSLFEDEFEKYINKLNDFFDYNDFENLKNYFSLEYNKELGFNFEYYEKKQFDSLKKENIDNIKTKDLKNYILSNIIIKEKVQNFDNDIDNINITSNIIIPEKKEFGKETNNKEIYKIDLNEANKDEGENKTFMAFNQEGLLKYLEDWVRK